MDRRALFAVSTILSCVAALHAGALPGVVAQEPDSPQGNVEDLPHVSADELRERFRDRRLAVDWRAFPKWPLDPVVEGDASVALELVDLADEPVASMVSLWRIDAPATSTWTAGRQRQQRIHVPVGGVAIEGLAEGVYGVQVDAAALASDDPPTFTVDLHRTRRIRLRVPRPEIREIFVRVLRPDGSELEAATLDFRPSGGVLQPHPTPAWGIPRQPRVRVKTPSLGQDVFHQVIAGPSRTLVKATPHGLPLGSHPGNTRSERVRLGLALEVDGVRLRSLDFASIDLDQSNHWAAVLVEPAFFEQSLRLPDGRNGSDPNVHVQVTPRIVPARGLGRAEALDACIVDVQVTCEGFGTLEFDWSPADGPPVPRRLEKAATPDPRDR